MREKRWQRVGGGGADELWLDPHLVALVRVRGEVKGVVDGCTAVVRSS